MGRMEAPCLLSIRHRQLEFVSVLRLHELDRLGSGAAGQGDLPDEVHRRPAFFIRGGSLPSECRPASLAPHQSEQTNQLVSIHQLNGCAVQAGQTSDTILISYEGDCLVARQKFDNGSEQGR